MAPEPSAPHRKTVPAPELDRYGPIFAAAFWTSFALIEWLTPLPAWAAFLLLLVAAVGIGAAWVWWSERRR